jgi:hypothetical protein
MIEHVEDLTTHIRRVQDNAMELAKALLKKGQHEFARVLLAKASIHDASKWHGIEWEYLHLGPDVDKDGLKAAITQHQKTNDHHPEYWGGVRNMPRICIAEMVCDWLARSQEFATDLRDWIRTQAVDRYNLDDAVQQTLWIHEFINMLLPAKFAKRV